jgi:hypothetical protein
MDPAPAFVLAELRSAVAVFGPVVAATTIPTPKFPLDPNLNCKPRSLEKNVSDAI